MRRYDRNPESKYGKKCKKCAEVFWAEAPQRALCDNCRPATWKSKAMYPKASLYSTGTIQELRVCVDLLAKGYEVYRAVSACAPFDLIAYRDGQHTTIEVKSAYDRGGRKLWVPNPTKVATVLAAVAADQIVYEPPLPS